jgi:multicomponent Na+:H+ antiporter subunit A
MVKAGVYLVMRLNPAFGETVAWETILPIFGGATLLTGGLLAVRQTDLKLMLAYTTVASLGLLVMLTGFGSEKAVEAAVLYLIAHSMFKGALFMVAGAIDHETGARDITKLGGLRGAMPITFAAAFVAALSMGGLPPLFGFLAKEEIYAALGFADGWTGLLTLVAIAGNALMFAIGFAVALMPFIGPRVETPKHAHEGPLLLWIGPATLSLIGIVTAVFAAWSHYNLTDPMASAVAGTAIHAHITLVPHIGLPLLLSAITVAIGIGIYLQLARLRGAVAATLTAIGWGPDKGFDQAVAGTIRVARVVTGFFQHGHMDRYMSVTFITIALALLLTPALFGEFPEWPQEFPDMPFYVWAILLVGVVGLWSVLAASNRLTAIVSLGIQGFAVALLFVLMGAPDLGFTQFMVETLSVVILALVMTRLRLSPADHRPTGEKTLDALIAGACGVGFGLFLLRVTQGAFDDTLTRFFSDYSYVVAHGRNIVNVILVDFRGLDTLGEITVVMVAGLAILALIRIRYQKSEAIEPAETRN